MIKLYGQDGRSFRCAWMLEELGIDYERVPIKFATDTQTPKYLAINPNGKIPALDDHGLVLFESLAINVHLARKYGGKLWPTDSNDQSATIQWLAWALSELEGPHDAKNKAGVPIDSARLERSLNALRQVLSSRPYLIGEHFTVADLNTAVILMRPSYIDVAKADAVIGTWFRSCLKRAAQFQLTSD